MAKDPRFLPADHEDSDQTARMHPRSLIGVFAGGIFSLVLTQKKKRKKTSKHEEMDREVDKCLVHEFSVI